MDVNEDTGVIDTDEELRVLQSRKDIINFSFGSPGSEALRGCESLLLEASKHVLDRPDIDIAGVLSYGMCQGDREFREELAKWLTVQYGDPVSSSSLMATAGASQGIHLLASLLTTSTCPVFVEDPTFFYGYRILSVDLGRKVVPIACDDDGMRLDLLEESIKQHKTDTGPTEGPYWAMIYLITVFQNPTGLTYSSEKCKQLVRIARKYNILIVSDDVYNLVYFNDDNVAPRRLISYDSKSDPGYGKGHVISNASFSKIFAPSLRLGWLEGPDELINKLGGSNYAWSGGCFNHFATKLITEVIKSGDLTRRIGNLRLLYKTRAQAVCEVLKRLMPSQCSFKIPKGGFFMWLTFPPDTDVIKLNHFAMENYGVAIMPAVCCSPTQSFQHCARLSFSQFDTEVLTKGAEKLAKACQAYFSKSPK